MRKNLIGSAASQGGGSAGPCPFHRNGLSDKKFLRRFFQKAATFFSDLLPARHGFRSPAAFAISRPSILNGLDMARQKRGRKIDGWLILDKPQGITSTQAVNKVKRALDAQKAGHGGTLDPLATGILPIALGNATKTVPYVMDGSKRYHFTITFGEARDTDDAEGAVIATSDARPTDEEIRAALPAFRGNIMQIPPAFSAIKVDGERAYDLARAGPPPDLPPRPAQVDRFEPIGRPSPDIAEFEA